MHTFNIINNKKRSIVILTYNAPHRKTFDVLCLLKAKGYENITVIAVDYHYQKIFMPIIEHRPKVNNNILPSDLSKSFGYAFEDYKTLSDFDYTRFNESIFLIGGSGIIPSKFAKNCRIINSHPAILPYVRGLDALKWSLLEDNPIGITIHLISDEPDCGLLIYQERVELQPFDNVQSIGIRLYDLEVRMLVESIDMLDDALVKNVMLDNNMSIAHKRMSKILEAKLLDKMIQRQNGFLKNMYFYGEIE
jgi:phosphoribosylglycinamide formyltransferase-1